MEVKKCVKETFSVIGKEGSTDDEIGFIKKLWEDANNHYYEHLFVKVENGIEETFSYMTNYLKENNLTF